MQLLSLLGFLAVLCLATPYDVVALGENHYSFFTQTDGYKANLNVFLPVPDATTRAYPLVLFFSGFGSNLPSAAYGEVLSEMASKGNGAVVVAWDGLGVANPLDIARVLDRTSAILQFCQGGALQAWIDKTFKAPVRIDVASTFFAAHSSGNQVAVLMGGKYPSNGLILLDPVDSDPVKWTHPVINGTVAYDKPVIVVASRYCEERGIQAGNIVPPCCPAGYSSTHFYDAFAAAPKFYFMAEDYGHADLLSPNPLAWAAHLSHFCGSVRDPRVNTFDAYRNFISGAVTSFMGMYSGKRDCSLSQYLTDATTFSIRTTSTYSLNQATKLC
ncbi:hypothetical protein HDV03_002864 [Kappamyces sp. JEL0829]|nr:hypothetical protein HDV03_002864 [Kappamyces sp. JEL0829]